MKHPPPVEAWVVQAVNEMWVVDKTGWTLEYVRSLDPFDLMQVMGYYEGVGFIHQLQNERRKAKSKPK